MKHPILIRLLYLGLAVMIGFSSSTEAWAASSSGSHKATNKATKSKTVAKAPGKPAKKAAKSTKPMVSEAKSKPAENPSLSQPQETPSSNPGLFLPFGMEQSAPNIMPPPLQAPEPLTKQVLVPPDTVLVIALEQEIHSKRNQVGDSVTASVADPLFLGPYEVIPKGTQITGKVTHVNPKQDQEGRKPYVVIVFESLKRPSESETYPMHASLIAYKSGLRGQDYVWRLPDKADRKRSAIKGVIGGAISGALINPIFGPLVGAGLGLVRTSVMDNFARGGDVEIKPGQNLPIAVDKEFMLPVNEVASPAGPTEPISTPTSVNTQDEAFARKNAEWQRTLAPLLGTQETTRL